MCLLCERMVRALASCARGPGFYPGCMCVCERVVTPLPRVQEVLGSIWSACLFVRVVTPLARVQEVPGSILAARVCDRVARVHGSCARGPGFYPGYMYMLCCVSDWMEYSLSMQEIPGSILAAFVCYVWEHLQHMSHVDEVLGSILAAFVLCESG